MTAQQPGKGPADWIRQLVLALDLPFLLIGAVMGGGLIGYVLDQWLHTEPWLMLILGGLGFYAGLRALLEALAVRGRPTGGKGPIGPTGPGGEQEGDGEQGGEQEGNSQEDEDGE
jgi:F0F1-type ATP synthase assembly protein I